MKNALEKEPEVTRLKICAILRTNFVPPAKTQLKTTTL